MTDDEVKSTVAKIQAAANKRFSHLLFKEVPDNEEVVKVALAASELPGIPEWKSKYYKVMAKELDTKKVVVNEDIEIQMNEFLDNEFKKAIKAGLLPKEYVPNLQNPKNS